jgi:hypothetical protein
LSIRRKQIMLELIAEVMLSFLPMVLVLLVLLSLRKTEEFFLKPEWAFGAAIFFGQAIVRLVAAIAHSHKDLNTGFLSVMVVLLILLGLGPSCGIVVLVLIGVETSSLPAQGSLFAVLLPVFQVILYLGSSLAYVFVGITARELE